MTTEGSAISTPDAVYDIAVIGAGVVGSAICRELAIRGVNTALIEARGDVGDATSKANTAILHTGFDANPGTLESALVARGYQLLRTYAGRANIPIEITGAILVAWDQQQLHELSHLQAKATRNGYLASELLTAQEIYAREPNLGTGVLGGLLVPDEGIICPWTTTLAFATEAVRHGAALHLDTNVTGVRIRDGLTVLETNNDDICARVVVNAAGLGSDWIHNLFGLSDFTLTPRRGQLMVFDKLARTLLSHVVLPVPTAAGKGVLVAPTVYGNVVLGPTSENLDDRTATNSTEPGVTFLLDHGRRILPGLLREEVTSIYAGLRAASDQDDYQVTFHPDLRYVCVAGIRSTGLTSSLALAEYVADRLDGIAEVRVGAMRHPTDDPRPPRMPYIGEAHLRPYRDAAKIADDPAYGHIVCFCERTTHGEIRDALTSVIPPRTVEGLRRRTRATMGRCQGFYCGAHVRSLLARPIGEHGDPPADPATQTREAEGDNR
jgi:glycerol-3-phosphate dehydrogenase